MSDFPTLQPAMTIRISIDPAIAVGSASKGTPLAVVPMTGGTIKSEEGFEPRLDAEFHGVGYDYIRQDPSGEYMRLDVRSQVKNHDGGLLALCYTGIIKITEGIGKVLAGADDAATVPYGDAFTHLTFEVRPDFYSSSSSCPLLSHENLAQTGSEALRPLETMVFVSAGRFVVEKGEAPVVEYKVSRVVAGR